MLPHSPDGDAAEAESVPVVVEHLAIERERSFSRHTVRWRHERREAIIDLGAIGATGAREKMPKGKCVFSASLREDDLKLPGVRFGGLLRRIEGIERIAKLKRGVFEVGSTRADPGAREAHGPSRDEGIAAMEMKTDPAERGAQGAGAVGGDFERIGAAEIDDGGRRRFDDKLRGRRPDSGVDGTQLKLEEFAIGAGLQKMDARVGLHADFAEVVLEDRSA